MTLEDGFRALVREVVREELELAVEMRPQPETLLDVDEARARLGGIARSTLYQLLDRGSLRSLTIGRRRVIPSSAIAEFATAEVRGGRKAGSGNQHPDPAEEADDAVRRLPAAS
jgi:excisionase family DNA binding protein